MRIKAKHLSHLSRSANMHHHREVGGIYYFTEVGTYMLAYSNRDVAISRCKAGNPVIGYANTDDGVSIEIFYPEL